MKCIYAIPSDSTNALRNFCRDYTEALASLSDSAVLKSDELRDAVEKGGWPMLLIEEEDWDSTKTAVVSRGLDKQGCWRKLFINAKEAKVTYDSDELRAILGKLFWSNDEAKSIAIALKVAPEPVCQSVALWLLTQVERGRSIVILSQ